MAANVKQPVPPAKVSTGGSLISDAKLKQLYATMLQCRLFAESARRLRSNRSILEASLGQEAIATGCAIDLGPADTIALAPHDSTASLVIARLVNGVPLSDLVAQMYANDGGQNHDRANATQSSTAEEQLNVATSIATASKRKKSTSVVVVFTCQAATTLACWHDALTLAAARKLPIIFVVENNRPAESVSDEQDFVLKAQSYGIPGITVDGNDVVAVYRVAHESLASVRRGDGPVLVEGKANRLLAQNGTSPRGSLHDPLAHMERYLVARKIFDARWKHRLVQEFSPELDAAVKAARKAQRPVQN
jgi:TPP-dependent pyruvate/acetoin dehydrogenase alpha subunit